MEAISSCFCPLTSFFSQLFLRLILSSHPNRLHLRGKGIRKDPDSPVFGHISVLRLGDVRGQKNIFIYLHQNYVAKNEGKPVS